VNGQRRTLADVPFAAPAAQCAELVREGGFYAGLALAQAVVEAVLTKEIKFGKLSVLPVRMNPDLAMGDELLKKNGAGHLFTVFGEPDVKLDTKDGKVIVTIRGVDVFDPGTGAVRTGGTDDIACWFIDSD
jgi:adenine-specific DNA-methyltransferase